jgi:hypothetical protein
MTVPLHERKISQLQFYRTGIELRAALTAWLMCDFGINPAKSKFGGAAVAPYLSDEDRKAIASILEKYNFQHLAFETFPDWWIVERRKAVDAHLQNMMAYIVQANSIFPVQESEYHERRRLQNLAISCIHALEEELQYIVAVLWKSFGVDVEKYMPFIGLCEQELKLLRGWRQSDNAILKRIRSRSEKRV